jgi:hypothetical protein
VEVGADERERQVLGRHHPAEAQLRERHPALQRPRPAARRHLLLLLALLLLLRHLPGALSLALLLLPVPAGAAAAAAEAAEQRAPPRPRHARPAASWSVGRWVAGWRWRDSARAATVYYLYPDEKKSLTGSFAPRRQ